MSESEQLRRSASLLEEACELARLGGWELDLVHGRAHWSPELHRLLELPPDQALHLDMLTSLIEPDYRERFQAAFELASRGEACDLELALTTAQGMPRWIRCVMHPQPPRLIGFCQDITRRKRTERELIEALNRVENLEYAINSSSLVSVMDGQGVLLHVNTRCCEATGYAFEELLGQTRALIAPDPYAPDFDEAIWASLRQGQPWRGEICCRSKAGEAFWVESQIMPIYDTQGHIEQYILIENLITERKTAELKLLRLQEGLKRLNLITSNLELDQGEKISQALRAVMEYFNLSFATVSRIEGGKYELTYALSLDPDFITPRLQTYPLAGSFCERVFRSGEMLSEASPGCEGLDHPCYRGLRFGSLLGQQLVIRGLPYGTVSIFGFEPREALCEQEREFFGIFTRWLASVIERQQFVDALKKANAGKDQLLQIMAHDLRNPVSSIQTRAALLLEGMAGGQGRYDAGELLEEIHDIADRAFLLMESILAAKDFNPSPHSLMTLPVELGTWLRHVVADFSFQAHEHGIDLMQAPASAAPEPPILVQIDPLMFRRVLDNLLSNALKYTPAGGRIEVSHRLEGERVELRVADTGIGIPAGQLPRLLAESWQLRREGLHGEPSHGLGISVVQDILSLHGASLAVESEEHKGTAFIISLPVELDEGE